jgi:transcriptional regulator with XRE-family HTH domain
MDQHEAFIRATCVVLRELRIKSGLSMMQLSKLSGLHKSHIGNFEIRPRNLSLLNTFRLAEALGLTSSQLVALVEEKIAHGLTSSRLLAQAEKKVEQIKVQPKVQPVRTHKAKPPTKPKPPAKRSPTFYRCLNGHRWTGKKSVCTTCHSPGFLIESLIRETEAYVAHVVWKRL